MSSTLLRNPRVGRLWYPPLREPLPRPVGREELVERAYAEGGPKHGVQPRGDAIDTLWRGYEYLRVRAGREDSADFATTAEQTILGLSYELSRRGAKAWDPTLGEGLEGKERRELLLHHRGRAMAKLLDELAGCGLLVWGGERDNNGLWWRLRIRLLDPDAPAPDPEPWMRGLAAPEDDPSGAGERRGGEADEQRTATAPAGSSATVDLAELYDRVEALTGHRPALAAVQVVQLRTAVRRFGRHAEHRPAGVSGDPLAVLLAQLEHFAPDPATALAWALPRFDGFTRRLEAASRAPGRAPSSPNSAALSNQHTPNVSEPSALACTTGARGPVNEVHDVNPRTTAEEGPGMAKQRAEGGRVETEALLERVATRERRLEALSPRLRAQEARTVARARQWPVGAPLPLGLLTETAQALAGGHGVARSWLGDRQVERLRRSEQRYTRYVAQRPDGSPPAPAAALIDLVEHAPHEVRQPLPWAIAQLDLLSKRMRREHRGHHPPGLARRRAQRRREQDAAHACAFFRRPAASEIDVAVEHLADGIAGRRAAGESGAAWEALEEQLQDAGELPTDSELAAAKERKRSGWHRLPIENRPAQPRAEPLALVARGRCASLSAAGPRPSARSSSAGVAGVEGPGWSSADRLARFPTPRVFHTMSHQAPATGPRFHFDRRVARISADDLAAGPRQRAAGITVAAVAHPAERRDGGAPKADPGAIKPVGSCLVALALEVDPQPRGNPAERAQGREVQPGEMARAHRLGSPWRQCDLEGQPRLWAPAL
ncbi:MAG: hypothetical protein LC790_11805 [Actinobacteria bacterium]|nr:hypothetical protein [Actinomycetota bacterium]